MEEQQRRSLINRYLQAYNSFDIDGMLATLHDGIEFKNMVGGEVTAEASGTEAFRHLAEQAKELFSARRQLVKAWSFRRDQATIDIEYEGVLATDLPNGMKRGETLRLTGASEFTFKGGLICRIVDRS